MPRASSSLRIWGTGDLMMALDPKQTKDIKFGRKIAFPIDVKTECGERIYYRATYEDKLIAVVFPQEENGDLVMRIERLYAHD